MVNLTQSEFEQLKKFRLSCENTTAHLAMNCLDLLEPEKLRVLIHDKNIQRKLNTSRKQVIGSMFMKRYAFVAALILYSMSAYNKGLNCSMENVSLLHNENDPIWLPHVYLKDLTVTIPDGSNRDQWRQTLVETLFKGHISPIISAVAKETKMSKTILWENTAIYIFWMYETLLQQELNEDERAIINSDFQYVVLDAPPELFGWKGTNPLSRFFVEKVENVRKRSTCCLFYFTSKNGDRCKTCPIECNKPNNN
ncbi:IucA/IucC family C-terminal-domain containing protein [Bacillus weihaiensis]|uniref:Aerobactin siderophore biosynthesis IucA/IucC-like C-terminal domain-containing protein n=1 Tax=Bacillus weihaiensis TaxID=1547283 RepID=A0A1L3MN46_9BACI|nr:IucA/IucC family C-terminal-domain containing protein [Bacillus weihaiensis]APH03766.1 hypothetical protein A9C19_02770 [Bacillus weihaiensis]